MITGLTALCSFIRHILISVLCCWFLILSVFPLPFWSLASRCLFLLRTSSRANLVFALRCCSHCLCCPVILEFVLLYSSWIPIRHEVCRYCSWQTVGSFLDHLLFRISCWLDQLVFSFSRGHRILRHLFWIWGFFQIVFFLVLLGPGKKHRGWELIVATRCQVLVF
jgi:hypothetical protein